MRKLESLLSASQDIVDLADRRKPANNLVLARQVELLHDFVKLLSQLEIFIFQLLKGEVLLGDEESQILGLVLRLTDNPFPPELDSICIFFLPDNLKVKIIVLFD